MGPGTSLIAPSSTHRNRMGFVGTCKLEGVEKSPRTLGLLLLGGHSANWWRQVPLALPPPTPPSFLLIQGALSLSPAASPSCYDISKGSEQSTGD